MSYKSKKKFPLEFINQVHLIKIFNENHAAAFYYLGDFRKKIPVGILSEDNSELEKPLLSPIYYLKKSLIQYPYKFCRASIKNLQEKSICYFFTFIQYNIRVRDAKTEGLGK